MGIGGAAAPSRPKKSFLLANAKFVGQKSAAKNEKKYRLLHLLNEENGIHSVQ